MPPRQSKPKAAKQRKVEAAPEPAAHIQIAALYAATLTAASFIAPKGMCCTLSQMAATVKALSGIELTAVALRQMVALDAGLGLRHVVASSGDVELELVLRESLRMVATPGVVRTRHRKFCALLRDHATLELPLAPLPPMPDGMPPPSASPSSRRSSGPVADMSGLPSPPPRQLRRADLAATRTPPGSADRSGTAPMPAAPQQPGSSQEQDSNGAERQINATGPTDDARCADDGNVLMAAIRDELRRAEGGDGEGRSTGRESATLRFLRALTRSPFFRDQVVHYHEQAARPAAFASPMTALSPAVRACLAAAGRSQLYTHQAKAVDALLSGGVSPARDALSMHSNHRFGVGPPASVHLHARHPHAQRRPLTMPSSLFLSVPHVRLFTRGCSRAPCPPTQHVMLCTPTASGKSLGYTVPTLQMASESADARFLYLFPTKALAQDQLRALRELSCAGGTA